MLDIDKLYYIMDYSGNYYKTNDRNELVVAKSNEQATEYSFIDANKRINTGHKNKFYFMTPVDEYKAEECSSSSERNVIAESNTEYDMSQMNWKEYLAEFVDVLESLKGYRESLIKAESDVDLKICDILHYIELCDTSDDEAAKLVQLLKECREHRRNVKDELICVETFQRTVGNSENVGKAKEAIKAIKGLDSRQYSPRKLSELFENKLMNIPVSKEKSHKTSAFIKSEMVEPVAIKKEGQDMELVRKDTAFDGKENDWMAFAMQQAEFYRNANQYMINIQADIAEIDVNIISLMEEIDTSNCNVAQGYKLFKRLKELRNERKKKENELKCLDILTGHFDMSAMANECENAANNIEKILYPNGVIQEETVDGNEGIITMVV